MTFWWEREPRRVLAEEDALRDLVAREVIGPYRWELSEGTGVQLQTTITLGPSEQAVEVRFPTHYPRECPSVRTVPYGKIVSSHQFRNGVFCLELGPDNWHPRYMAANMLESTWRLLLHETLAELGPWEIPSRHVAHVGQFVQQNLLVFIRPPSFADQLVALPDEGEFGVRIVCGDENGRIWPVELPLGVPLPGVPTALREKTVVGRFLRLAVDAPRELPGERQTFIEFVREHTGYRCEDKFKCFLFLWPDGYARSYYLTESSVLTSVDVPLEDGSARVPPRTEALAASLRVGIVGLGSLGSKVAVSLARSGVRRFILVDEDVLLGPNIQRHACRYEQVGMMKVAAVASLLREVSSEDVECHKSSLELASATNPELHARELEKLGAVDVLVDATANPDAFNVLAEVASRGQIPLVWAEVFEGGLGGLVGVAHPRRTPCPSCVRDGFLAQAEGWPPAPRSGSLRPYEGGGDVPVAATDADVSFVAAALATRVLEVGDEAADPAAAVMLFGLRRGWIFERVFDTVRVEVLADDWSCAWCWKEPETPDPEALRKARAVLTGGGPDADDPDRA